MAQAVETPKIQNRKMLVEALQQASELEHGLCCLYLFAAFSLRKTLDDFASTGGDEQARRVVMQRNQRWEATVLEVPGERGRPGAGLQRHHGAGRRTTPVSREESSA